MFDQGGGEDDDASWREFNTKLEVPQHEVAAEPRVEVANRENGTAAVHYVEMVCMAIGARLGAEIEVSPPKHAPNEVPAENRMSTGEGLQCGFVVLV